MPRRMDQLNKWRDHLADYRSKHPNLSLKQCMVNASKTYRSGKKGGSLVSDALANPAVRSLALGLMSQALGMGKKKRNKRGGFVSPDGDGRFFRTLPYRGIAY